MIDHHEQVRQSTLRWRRLRLWAEALQNAKRLLTLTHVIAAWVLLAVVIGLSDQLSDAKTVTAVVQTVLAVKSIEEQSWRCTAYGGRAVTAETTIKMCTRTNAVGLR